MPIKHKVLKDFQFLTPDKKIIILKAKSTIIDYKYVTKTEDLTLERDIIDNNPDFFSLIDWKEELNSYIKQNKIAQPAIITKKLIPFIEEMFVLNAPKTETIERIIEVPVEKIVEKIVEKKIEVPVEKIIEKKVENLEKEIEIETTLRKLEIRETKLKEELESVHLKESDLNQKEKELETLKNTLSARTEELNAISSGLESKESDLNQRESVISEKESVLREKENNLNQYIPRSAIMAKIQELKSQGWDMSMMDRVMSSI